MKLHVLGSGSCVVDQQDRTPSGYVLEVDNLVLLVDTGTGVTRNLPELGLSVDEIDAVINTHRHPDHVSDLVPVVQDKVVRSFAQDEPAITLYGPEGHIEYLEDRMKHEMVDLPGEIEEKFGFGFEVVEVGDRINLSDNIVMKTIEADHGPEGFTCLSLRIEGPDKTIVFTGDTDYFEELGEFAEDADLLVTDCSKPDELKVEGHMTPTESAKIARNAGVETLLLSHLYPETDGYDIVSKASKTFSGKVVEAEDLMSIQV
ncbi:MAG: MBL fold metallo-hydrolase [Candidatus Nanohaloarchaea archaeon]